MSHHHEHTGKNLLITILLNVVITVGQVIGGIISGSIALLSDATHNFSDVISLIISFFAKKISKKPATENKTFGYKRIEILATIFNVTVIIIIAVNILIVGIKRIISPQEIAGKLVIYLAILSIVVNGLSVIIIKEDAKHSMNIKSSYLHLFTDMLTSIAVLVGGLLMLLTKAYWIDGVISIIIGGYLIYVSLKLLLDATKIIMEYSPATLDLKLLKEEIEKFDYIENIHNAHLWQITDNETAIQFHARFNQNFDIKTVEQKVQEITHLLKDKYGIDICNIQSEYEAKDEQDLIVNKERRDHEHH